MKLQINDVKDTQVNQLCRIIKVTFLETFAHSNTAENIEVYSKRAFSRTQILCELQNDMSYFFFVYYEDKVVGYLKLNVEQAQTESDLENAVEIERIYVLDEFQGRGIGKTLFEFSVEFARNRGADWLWLGVWDQNTKAIKFYQLQGLRKFSQHIFLLGTEQQTDILMRMDL